MNAVDGKPQQFQRLSNFVKIDARIALDSNHACLARCDGASNSSVIAFEP